MVHETASPAVDLELPEVLLRLPSFVMLQLLRHGRRGAERSPEGPRLPHFSVLAALDQFGPQSQRDVSRRLGFDPSDIVGVVDQLEAEGHAVRARDPADRRRYALAITPAGRRWLRDRVAVFDDRISLLLPGLDRGERELLAALLLRALAHQDPRVPARHRDAGRQSEAAQS